MRSDPRVPRVLTRVDAIALGMTRPAIDRRLAAGRWQRVLPRTYFTAAHLTERDRCDAALAFAGSGAAVSGAAALRATEVRGVAERRSILVLVPPENRIESAGWAQVRRTHRPIEVENWFGPRRVVPARAAADLALTLRRIDDVRSLVARVVGDGHARLDDLAAELAAGPRGGSALFRQALEEVGAGAASAPEARAARILKRLRAPSFVQNARIELPRGGWYVADFLWRELMAVLEIDSQEYHLGPTQWRATMDRHLVLTTLGYSVVHRPPSAMRDETAFGRDVLGWLDSCARRRLDA